jgi:anti-anti-sigma regulatory factor
MPTRITEVECEEEAGRHLKVEGTLTLVDAELLAGVCHEMLEQGDYSIRIDLEEITFLDSESAHVLCRLKREGIRLEGLDLFVRKVVEVTENNGNA